MVAWVEVLVVLGRREQELEQVARRRRRDTHRSLSRCR